MRSEYIKYARLELFSRVQQVEFPLEGLDHAAQVVLIEQIINFYTFKR